MYSQVKILRFPFLCKKKKQQKIDPENGGGEEGWELIWCPRRHRT